MSNTDKALKYYSCEYRCFGSTGIGRFPTTVCATPETLDVILLKRNMGEQVSALPDKALNDLPLYVKIAKYGCTLGVLHYAIFIGFLALRSKVATDDQILGDTGLVHEIAHCLHFPEEPTIACPFKCEISSRHGIRLSCLNRLHHFLFSGAVSLEGWIISTYPSHDIKDVSYFYNVNLNLRNHPHRSRSQGRGLFQLTQRLQKVRVMNEKKFKACPLDLDDLATEILQLDDSVEGDDIDQAIFNEFGCSYEAFAKIVNALTPLAAEGQSRLTGKHVRGFAVDGALIVKMEVTAPAPE